MHLLVWIISCTKCTVRISKCDVFFVPRIMVIVILQTRRFSGTNIRITYTYIVLYIVREIGLGPRKFTFYQFVRQKF